MERRTARGPSRATRRSGRPGRTAAQTAAHAAKSTSTTPCWPPTRALRTTTRRARSTSQDDVGVNIAGAADLSSLGSALQQSVLAVEDLSEDVLVAAGFAAEGLDALLAQFMPPSARLRATAVTHMSLS